MTDEILDNLQASPSDTQQDVNITNTPAESAPVVPQTWPDNWRYEMAGGDEKELNRLERKKAPTDVYKSYRELEKIKSSCVPAPKKPTSESTPEEVKAYRESIGVPEDYKAYDLSFDDGTAIGEDLMPAVDGYLKFAHESNLPPEVVKSNIKWFMDDIAQEQARVKQANDEARVNGLVQLKSEWGGEFQGNMNAIHSLFTEAPEGVQQSLFNAVGADGLKFANNPDNIRWLVNVAKAINPTASLLPAGVNTEAGIDTELEKLQSMMHSKDPAESNKYWKDPKAQERFLALTQAKQKGR
jgi:hypothetical protein